MEGCMMPAEHIERARQEIASASARHGVDLDDVQRELLRAHSALTRAVATLQQAPKPQETKR